MNNLIQNQSQESLKGQENIKKTTTNSYTIQTINSKIMKTKLFLFGLLSVVLSLETMAQSSAIEIIQKNKFMPPTCKKCDIELSQEQFLNLFKNDPSMTSIYNSMNVDYGINALLSAAGGILITLPVYQKLHKDEPNWNLAFIGAGCYALSIPFKISFHKKSREAIALYNAAHCKEETVQLNVGFNKNGLGLTWNF